MNNVTPIHPRYLDIREVTRRTSLSKPTIYRMVAAGRFPRHIKLTEQRSAWWEHEVEAWMRDRATQQPEQQPA